MPPLTNEVPTDDELRRYLMGQWGLLDESYAPAFPDCDAFCARARESIFESLRRLNRLPRTDPFWSGTNLRPTLYKLRDFCRHLLSGDPQDRLALWTLAALDVAVGVDGFGCAHWKALHTLGSLDATWPICAALLQGGPAGLSDAALAAFLGETDAIEAARPHLQRHANSLDSNISAWATRVSSMLEVTAGGPDA